MRDEQPKTENQSAVDELEKLAEEVGAGDDYQPELSRSEDAQPKTGDVIAGLLVVTFGFVASKRGPHWQLSPAEANELGSAYGAVIDKYWPDFQSGVELTAIGLTLAVAAPRLVEDVKKQRSALTRQRRKQEIDQSADQAVSNGQQPE